ncbi:hypothetical protein SALBM311S_01603 [Streptomyces alboniger]
MSSMSYSLSTSRFPVSRDSARASAALSRTSSSATRSSRSPRSFGDVRGHGPSSKARRAASIAATVSLPPASSTTPTREPSAGQRISRVRPSTAPRHAPSMNRSAMAASSLSTSHSWKIPMWCSVGTSTPPLR